MSANVLTVDNLVVRYGPRAVVDELSFHVRRGEIVGIVGPNGAGKTTTLRAVTGQTPVASGRLLLGDDDVTAAPERLRGRVGVIPQDVALFDELTATETLTLVGSLRGLSGAALTREVERWIELAALDGARNVASRYFSGGMKRKLAIGAALIGDPELLVLDESFAGLDPEATWAIERELLRHRERGAGILLCTHLLDFLDREADRVLLLAGGTLADELVRQPDGALGPAPWPGLVSWYLDRVRRPAPRPGVASVADPVS